MDEKKFPIHRKVEYDYGALLVDVEPQELLKRGYEFWGNRSWDQSLEQSDELEAAFQRDVKNREFALTESGLALPPRLAQAHDLRSFALDALSAGFDLRLIRGSYHNDTKTVELNAATIAVFGRFNLDRFITRMVKTSDQNPLLVEGYLPTGSFFPFQHWGDFGILTPEQIAQNDTIITYIRTQEAQGTHIRLLEKDDNEGRYLLISYGRPKEIQRLDRFRVERPLSGFSDESPRLLMARGFHFFESVEDDKTLDTTTGALPIALDPSYLKELKNLTERGLPKKTRRAAPTPTLRKKIIEALRYGNEVRAVAGAYDPSTGVLDTGRKNRVSIFWRFDLGRFIEPTQISPKELKNKGYTFSSNMSLYRWGDTIDELSTHDLAIVKQQIQAVENHVLDKEEAGFHVRLLQGRYSLSASKGSSEFTIDHRSVAVFVKKKG